MKRSLLSILPLLALPLLLQAQPEPRATITGHVLDDSTGAPLPIANVFVSNSTVGAATNLDGRFELKGVPLGMQQIVASIVGYEPGVVAVRLKDSSTVKLEIRLKPRAVQLPGVEVEAKDPVEWRKKLEGFLKEFIGSTPNAELCRIMNPEVLDFAEEPGPLIASAREPLEIENKSLGYHIRCILVHFSFSKQTIQFIVLTSYTELKPRDRVEAEEWQINRRDTYFGSKQHFFRALLERRTREERFEVNRVPRNLLKQGLNRAAGYDIDPDTLLAPGEFPFQKKLSFPDLLQVIYKHRRERQISLIEMNRPQITVYSNGSLDDPLGLWTYGTWSQQRFAEMLPIDYRP